MQLEIEYKQAGPDGHAPMILCQEWITGEPSDSESAVESFVLVSSAGLGGSQVQLRLKMRDGTRRDGWFSMADVLPQWVEQLAASDDSEHETRADKENAEHDADLANAAE